MYFGEPRQFELSIRTRMKSARTCLSGYTSQHQRMYQTKHLRSGSRYCFFLFLTYTTVVMATANRIVNPMYGNNRLSLLVGM